MAHNFQVRKIVSDFAVLLAIVTMTAFDHSMNLETPKLIVPDEITPTRGDRGWIRDTKSKNYFEGESFINFLRLKSVSLP